MKFNCGPTADVRAARKWAHKKQRLEQWHPFFCLLPRRIDDETCVWLETIQRKGRYIDHCYGPATWRFEFRLGTVKEFFK